MSASACVRVLVTLLRFQRHLVRAAVLRAAQRADGPGDGRVDIGAGAGDDARREGAGVEFMLGIQDQRGVHGAHPQRRRRLQVQQAQEVRAHRIVFGLHLDAQAVVAVVVPVAQRRAQAGHQPIDDVARAGQVVVIPFGQQAAQRRDRRAHHVHRVRGRGQQLEHVPQCLGQHPQGTELAFVGGELHCVRQPLMHQQVRDFLEFAGLGQLEDVVAAVVQVVAGAPYRAQRRVAGHHAGQRHRLLGLADRCCRGITHGSSPRLAANNSSSFCS